MKGKESDCPLAVGEVEEVSRILIRTKANKNKNNNTNSKNTSTNTSNSNDEKGIPQYAPKNANPHEKGP